MKVSTTIGKSVELTTGKLGRMVMDGVARFCSSAQAEPQAWHIPVDPLIDEELADALRAGCCRASRRSGVKASTPRASHP
ncbi:hypothetical protein [Cupriavidus necator]|uniref:hypothetical protein n=1 Tax=Cupriavidus necator TaxID=106590 RepID=UPI0030F3B6B6